MDADDFEGTLVLEQLAETGQLEGFWDAVDADDLEAARAQMRLADIDDDTIEIVLTKMQDADGEH